MIIYLIYATAKVAQVTSCIISDPGHNTYIYYIYHEKCMSFIKKFADCRQDLFWRQDLFFYDFYGNFRRSIFRFKRFFYGLSIYMSSVLSCKFADFPDISAALKSTPILTAFLPADSFLMPMLVHVRIC